VGEENKYLISDWSGGRHGALRWKRKRGHGNDQTVMDSRKGIHDGVEKIEMNLKVKAEFTGDVQGGRKSSLNHRRKFAGTQAVDEELGRGVEGATSGGSRWGFRIWNQRVEENTGIYIGLGFGNFWNTRYFIIFRIN
jgi:hypothetical protein